MVLDVFVLVVSIMLLAKFSDITIEKAAVLSRLTGISHLMIGFFFIALSTSLPELSIAVISGIAKENQLSFGNLVGANITLLTLVMGVMIIYGFRPQKKDFLKLDLAVIITTIIALTLIALEVSDAAVAIFSVILFYLFSLEISREGLDVGAKEKSKELPIMHKVKGSVELVISVLMVVASAYIVTHSAITISKNFGIAEAILGATILSIGTTLPELSVNMAAIKKRDIGLAIGDTIGSLVTNLTLILGISSIINPITISNLESFLLGFFVLVSIIILFLATRMRFDKWTGVVLISIYVAYILSLTVFA